jgi:hypothetical protein
MARTTTEPRADDTAPPDLGDPAVRARMSGPGFRAFVAVSDELGLSIAQRLRLLGGIGESTYHKWRSQTAKSLTSDQLERISLVLGIFKGLRLLFLDDATSLRWLTAANTDLPFSGDSPLQTMLRGSIDNLYAVRRYVDAWRGVWP